jgi:hypothetical protein
MEGVGVGTIMSFKYVLKKVDVTFLLHSYSCGFLCRAHKTRRVSVHLLNCSILTTFQSFRLYNIQFSDDSFLLVGYKLEGNDNDQISGTTPVFSCRDSGKQEIPVSVSCTLA